MAYNIKPYSTEDIINGRQVMQMLDIVSRTVFKRIRERGEIPYHSRPNSNRKNDRRIYYYRSEIEALLHPASLYPRLEKQPMQTPHEFTFDGNFQIRTQTLAGQPWFVAKDVCRALSISNYRDAMSRLDPDERGSVVMDTPGGKQKMAAVNESGLYNLIFQSRKARALAFRKWVTSVVLPTIRRTGSFSGSEPKPSLEILFPANGFYSTTTWTA